MVEDGACSFPKQSIRRFLRLLGVAVLAMIASAPLYALDFERKDYRITVPDGSTADPEDPDIDLDHFTTINFPDENFIIILVVDDNDKTEGAFDIMKKFYMSKMEGASGSKSTFLSEHKGPATLLNGKLNGIASSIELGWFTGKTQGYIIVAGCPQSERPSFGKVLKKAITSFKKK